MVFQAASVAISRKNNSQVSKFVRPSPVWWNNNCTVTVKNRAITFRTFRRSHSINDFLV
jgi:hypothetical protein